MGRPDVQIRRRRTGAIITTGKKAREMMFLHLVLHSILSASLQKDFHTFNTYVISRAEQYLDE